MVTLEEAGFRRMLRLRGRNLKLLDGPDAGKGFRATINRIGAFTMPGDLGDDPRGKRIMETVATGIPTLVSQGLVQDRQNSEVYIVVDVGLDSPDYTRKFVLKQKLDQDT